MRTTLRVATQNNAEAVLIINLRSIFELCSSAYDYSQLYRWIGNRTANNFGKQIERGQIYIAEIEGQAFGFSNVPGEGRFAFCPAGREKGIGSFLLTTAVEKARIADGPVNRRWSPYWDGAVVRGKNSGSKQDTNLLYPLDPNH